MKKIIALILCLVMTLTLAACAGGNGGDTTVQTTTEPQEVAFSVGYGRVDMEPALGLRKAAMRWIMATLLQAQANC